MEIKIRKTGMSDNIPFDMQVEIMKRLPVKALAVFRSVSKAWKSVIDSRLFVADYTNFHQQHRLLIRYMIDYKFGYYYQYVSIVDNDTLSRHEFQIVIANVPGSVVQLVGTSQGLLCLFGDYRVDDCIKKTAVIWNPSLGKSIAIDVPVVGDSDSTVLGFGVRPDNLDPMIVTIDYVEHCYEVMLFVLSSRDWRTPRGRLPPKSIVFSHGTPVATDRCIYWEACEVSIYLVVAFDMVCETFTEINLPHCVAHRSSNEDFSISMIRGSLALLEWYDDVKKQGCDVWMMVDNGASKSFTKLFTINIPSLPSLSTEVLGFRKNDQPIMQTAGYRHPASLELYEPRTGTIKKTGINLEEGSYFLSSYTETLLLLDQVDEQVVTIQLLNQSS
uniref:putative F-box protein At3g10240 n=1 Tax=Erigeron canadensis TaxID=72917 RepID=UPI001CB95B40|nr:putative F-box protein At3g10240 [Erigeron canadensis]